MQPLLLWAVFLPCDPPDSSAGLSPTGPSPVLCDLNSHSLVTGMESPDRDKGACSQGGSHDPTQLGYTGNLRTGLDPSLGCLALQPPAGGEQEERTLGICTQVLKTHGTSFHPELPPSVPQDSF